MGYIPMQHNVIAAQYGNRVQAAQPLIKANPPVFRVTAKRIDRRKDDDTHACRPLQSSGRYVTGKGHRFDAMA
ncbi:hypothetical protein [Salicibibacter kimchii]|uniref:Uncharacterized protein n=1 Tax=Salicibibacter kimchii TaxID=2099786 RepID=A0A345BXG9_9BACI|nr:hypothetical protein [Salicibibacter kimchii]AXF55650.1 hypothetical protein DT065_06190 [Salicibibacter kimchii]